MNLLRRAFEPPDACRKLTKKMQDYTGFPIYCDGVRVPASFVIRLMVEPNFDDKEKRWSADIVSAVHEAWDRPSERDPRPYDWKFDVDAVAGLLPLRRGRKGVNWEIHTILELERLGRKVALDKRNSGQLRTHLERFLKREINFVPKDSKALEQVIRGFLHPVD